MLLRSRAQCWAKVVRVAVTEYVRVLDVDVRRRHYHETRRGQVVAFVVQLEVEVADTWVAVVRYDTAHGVPHVHRLETMTRVSRQTLDVPAGEALTLAQKDLAQNWSQYREEFVRRMR